MICDRKMKKIITFPVVLAMCLLISMSCTAIGDPLVGEFSINKNGEPEVKVLKKEGYYFSVKSRGIWDGYVKLQAFTKKDLEKIFGQECNDSLLAGIGGGQGFMLLHVRSGASCGSLTFQSDYFMKTLFGGVFLYKVK